MITLGEVVDIRDIQNGSRVRVRIRPTDNDLTDDKVPFGYPLLPKMLHVKPKLHEMVFVIFADDKDAQSQRYYIGPVISQPQYFEKQLYGAGASDLLQGATEKKNTLLDRITDKFKKILTPAEIAQKEKEIKQLLPNDNDIAISSRKNTDILLKDNDIQIRCGVKLLDNSLIEFNTTKSAFFKLKHYPYSYSFTHNNKTETINSAATIYADKINLISTNGNPHIPINSAEELLNDKAIEEFIKTAHPIPYGDKLCEMLSELIKVFREHTHNYTNLSPVPDPNYVNFVMKYGYDGNRLKEMLLSKNINVN